MSMNLEIKEIRLIGRLDRPGGFALDWMLLLHNPLLLFSCRGSTTREKQAQQTPHVFSALFSKWRRVHRWEGSEVVAIVKWYEAKQ